MAKWNPEDVKMTTDPHGIGTAYVTLRNSDDAHEVISRLHGCDWYGRRLIVRHAIGDEVRLIALICNFELDLIVNDVNRLLTCCSLGIWAFGNL